jgi:hypothetical protein
MWSILQIAVAFAVGSWVISLGGDNGRAAGIAGGLAAFAVTFVIAYAIDFCRSMFARLTRRQWQTPDSYSESDLPALGRRDQAMIQSAARNLPSERDRRAVG